MKTQTPQFGLAVLSHQHHRHHGSFAVLSFDLDALTSNIGEINSHSRVQLLPDGLFSAIDGRPFDVVGNQWLMDALAFENIQANATTRTNDFHFDYEHQTLNSDLNGQPAPAAGWFKQLEYVPGQGLFALNVDWTDNAAKFIANKEYRYTSAVFSYDKKSGRPLSLLHVALTNQPALDGMKAIAALKQQASIQSQSESLTSTGDAPMNDALKLLLSLLGIDEPTDYTEAASLKLATDNAQAAIAALKAKADKADTLAAELNTARESVAALKASQGTQAGEVDLGKFVPKDTYDALLTEVVALKAGSDKDSVAQLLKDNADKVLAAEHDYLVSFGKQQGVAALKALLGSRPAITALKSQQSQQHQQEAQTGQLTADEQYAAEQLGLSPDDFKAK